MKRALRVLIALIAIVLAGGFLGPSRVRIERSRTLASAPAQLYPLLADLRSGWPKWSPFGKAHDPALQETFSGPAAGAGATESWTSGSMPAGQMTLTRADPASGVDFRIEMENGTRIDGRIAFAEAPRGTRVTWTDDVQLPRGPMTGWMALLLRPMLGSGMETALQQLDAKALKP